jgi:hypothetical protein
MISVKEHILALALQHGVSGEQTDETRRAEAITRLSDNTTTHNEATRALVALQQLGAIDASEGHRLLDALLDEMGD